MKEILKALWEYKFKSGNPVKSGRDIDVSTEELEMLRDRGFVEKVGDAYRLTEMGRSQLMVVVCGGVFDILHPGHAFFLEKAKEYGDILVVIVARDSTVQKRKRIPIIPEEQRVDMVSQLKPVDVAVLGRKGDFLRIIEEIKPDIIALGPDQYHDARYIQDELKKRGLEVNVRKIKEYKHCQLHSTKTILQKIIERNYPKP